VVITRGGAHSFTQNPSKADLFDYIERFHNATPALDNRPHNPKESERQAGLA
jgi:hypothetical protein